MKVLSHNLYTVLQIPHQNSELEEHFKDDDQGPVSTQGYMPYLNTFILDRVNRVRPPLLLILSSWCFFSIKKNNKTFLQVLC